MVRQRKPPSQTWRTFLDNHVPDITAYDFFTLPTATFRVLYVFIVLRHDRRQVVHFDITTNPSAEWTAQQIVNAFPYDEAPRFLIRDHDGIYAKYFRDRVDSMGIEEAPCPYHKLHLLTLQRLTAFRKTGALRQDNRFFKLGKSEAGDSMVGVAGLRIGRA